MKKIAPAPQEILRIQNLGLKVKSTRKIPPGSHKIDTATGHGARNKLKDDQEMSKIIIEKDFDRIRRAKGCQKRGKSNLSFIHLQKISGQVEYLEYLSLISQSEAYNGLSCFRAALQKAFQAILTRPHDAKAWVDAAKVLSSNEMNRAAEAFLEEALNCESESANYFGVVVIRKLIRENRRDRLIREGLGESYATVIAQLMPTFDEAIKQSRCVFNFSSKYLSGDLSSGNFGDSDRKKQLKEMKEDFKKREMRYGNSSNISMMTYN